MPNLEQQISQIQKELQGVRRAQERQADILEWVALTVRRRVEIDTPGVKTRVRELERKLWLAPRQW